MAVEVVMPRLGWTMESGVIAEWLKQDGEPVQAGEILFAVETDKVAQEVEALDGGVLRLLPSALQSGASIPVGTILAYLLQPGESLPAATLQVSATGSPQQGDDELDVVATAPQKAPDLDGRLEPTISPRAKRVARELGVDWLSLGGSGSTGRIVERDVRAAATASTPVRARVTPLARRVALQTGVDVADLAAQMPGARITRADVEAATVASAATVRTSTGQPMGTTRRIIAERMSLSAHTAAPVTLTTEVDATDLVQVRERIKSDVAGTDHPVPSYNDLLARLIALLLLEHSGLNVSFVDGLIVQHPDVHIGLAVDTEQGLLVPVVRDAHLKSVGSIARESALLIQRARAGRIGADDLKGSTFTITNLGMYEIDAFTPIINLPECAILGVGRIVARQVVTDEVAGTVAIRKMMVLSLTFDHRVVDGAPAARFLQQIKRWIERPYVWLTR